MALFGKKEQVSLDLQSISTLISEGCILDGNLKAPAFARIDGQVTGDVMVDEGLDFRRTRLNPRKRCYQRNGSLWCLVTGNLQVNSLEIKATGKVTGEIRTQVLAVENGAVYNGSLSMTQNNKLAQSNKNKQTSPEGY